MIFALSIFFSAASQRYPRHIGVSGVVGNQLRSSRMLEFLVALVVLFLLVPYANQVSVLGLCNQLPAYGLKPSPKQQVSAPTQSAIKDDILAQPPPQGAKYYFMRVDLNQNHGKTSLALRTSKPAAR